MKFFDYRFCAMTMLVALLSNCNDESINRRTSSASGGSDATSEKSATISVDVGAIEDGLGLTASASAFSIEVSCAGQANLTVTGPSFNLIDGSTGCAGKLRSMVVNGLTYTPKAGADFPSTMAGQVATFESGNKQLFAVIKTQLPATISGSATLSFGFSENAAAVDMVVAAIASMSATVVGSLAPALSLSALTSSTTAINVKGICTEVITNASSGIANAKCAGDKFSDIMAKVVPYPSGAIDSPYLTSVTASAQDVVALGATLIAAGGSVNSNGGFSFNVPLQSSATSMLIVFKVRGGDSYLYGKITVASNPTSSQPNAWTVINPAVSPVDSSRAFHSAVWDAAGLRMLIFGGKNSANQMAANGLVYNSSSQSWSNMAVPSFSLPGRLNPLAFWTGTEMIVWGGTADGSSAVLPSGGRYNPTTNTWTALPAVATNSMATSGVWTGTGTGTNGEMIVWPCGGTQKVCRYNLASNSWTIVTTTGQEPLERTGHKALWTGSEMIVWGGQTVNGVVATLNDGGRFNPVNNTWTPMSYTAANVPSVRNSNSVVLVGSKMIVWGGVNEFGVQNSGAVYNLSTGTWTPMSTTGAPAARFSHIAVAVNSKMIVYGGRNYSAYFDSGAIYNADTDAWSTITPFGANPGNSGAQAFKVGSGWVMSWGGSNNAGAVNTGWLFDPG